jgi:hypothetical protein
MTTLSINTNYPTSPDTVITVSGAPSDTDVHVRIPSWISNANITTELIGSSKRISVSGKLGHWVEETPGGVVLRYGPLVLSPSAYYWNTEHETIDTTVPDGYIPRFLPAGMPELLVGDTDSDNFLKLDSEPLPDWSYYDEGPGARLAVGKAAVNVRTLFESGEEVVIRFWPLCYNTSDLSIYESPIVFKGARKS